METAECMDLLNTAEASVPVSAWRGAGVQAWPVVRSHLFWAATGLGHGSRSSRASVNAARELRHAGTALGERLAQRVRDRAHEARVRPADVLMLGDPHSRVLLDGNWYDRHCDPLVDTLDELGLRALHLEPHHVYRRPRHRPSLPIQHLLDSDRVRNRAGRPPMVELPGYDEFARLVSARMPLPPSIEPAAIARHLELLARMSARFAGLLDAVRPQLALVVDYTIASMAFNTACRRAGVPSVDLQHGLQGPLHFAYGRWSHVPPDGYEQLARYFWVWSDYEADAINAWGSTTAQHEAIVGGDAWLQMWTDDENPLVRNYDSAFQQLLDERPADQHVLFTLLPGAVPHNVRTALRAMQGSPNVRWWLRDHPASTPTERRKLLQAISGVPGAVADCETATGLPLPALLRHMDAHVTHNSSAVIEAAALGVPSILTDPQGRLYFPREAERGDLVVADPADLAEAVRSIAAAIRRRPARQPDRRVAVLTDLIARSRPA